MTSGDGPSGGLHPTDGRSADDAGLARSTSGLAALSLLGLPLRELLTQVARYAVETVPGADGVGLTLFEGDRVDTRVATAGFVSAVDEVQDGLGEGPCIAAAREGATVVSGSLGDEARWGTFGARVAALGVHSVVSLPLKQGADVLAAMNVYALDRHAFGDRAARLGEAFAVPAAVTVQHAHVLERARRVAAELRAELAVRSVVEQAVGVRMGRDGVRADEAHRLFAQEAEERAVPLVVVAREVVDGAVRAARRGGTTAR